MEVLLSKKRFTSICDRREWTNNPVSSAYIKLGFSGVQKKKNEQGKKNSGRSLYLYCLALHGSR